MIELSCKSEYAILALLELATRYEEGEPLQIRQIATQQNIPDRYLEQLLATLRRGGLIRSQRGAKGGYFLAREPWKITLLDIIICLEGSEDESSEKNAPQARKTPESVVLCEVWQEARQIAYSVLQKYTLQELCEIRNTKQQLDIMYYI